MTDHKSSYTFVSVYMRMNLLGLLQGWQLGDQALFDEQLFQLSALVHCMC